MVTGGSDPPDDFPVPLDDPNEEVTEQWHDDLHEWYICRNDQCPVESTKISSDFSQRRGHHRVCSCLKRRFVSASVVFSQKPSVVAWFQRCLCVFHLFGLRAPRKVDSSTHIPANGSSVVGKIATTARMMCLYLLMVGITFCLDRAVHAPHGADVCSTNSSSVNTFHVDSWNSRDNVSTVFREDFGETVLTWWQLGGQVTNPEDRDTAVRLRGYKTRHVQQHRLATVSDRARWRGKLEES